MTAITPNMLKQWADFYTQQMGPSVGSGQGGYEGALARYSDRGSALNFAQQMAQAMNGPGGMQQAPDFFAGVPSTTTPPVAPQQGYNRLAMLMGRRY